MAIFLSPISCFYTPITEIHGRLLNLISLGEHVHVILQLWLRTLYSEKSSTVYLQSLEWRPHHFLYRDFIKAWDRDGVQHCL